MSAPDPGQVTAMAGYDIGFLPPPLCDLEAGRLYVELTPPGGGVPRLWAGTAPESGFPGNAVLLIPVLPETPEAVDIVIDAIDNPSPNDTVHIAGTVTPGAEIELCAYTGTGAFLDQATNWSPWDATAGTFDMAWWLPTGDNYRIRARLRSDPRVYADSNLFAAREDVE
jgi:hypothetical protein